MIEGKQRQLYIGKVTELVTKYVEKQNQVFWGNRKEEK